MELTKTIVFTICSFFVSFSSATSVVDFCVADFNYPNSPAGFPCRNPANLTASDFVFSGLGVPGNTSDNMFNIALAAAIDQTFPALNGIGLSLFRADIGVGGVVPLHTAGSSELILVIEGSIFAGFIASDNTPYYKTLNKGDIMIFPPGLLHFEVNVGEIPALAFTVLNDPHPQVQIITPSLGANNLPIEIIEKITLFDAQQVKKLKNIFGGTN